MKRNKGPKIIQISGIKGIFLAAFIVVCLFAGFIIFPAKVAMYIWNYISYTYFAIPAINLWQGVLLWTIVAMSIYLINNQKFAISFQQPMELSDEEMKLLMERIKLQKQAQKLNAMILKSNDIKILKKDIEQKQTNQNSEETNNINEKRS